MQFDQDTHKSGGGSAAAEDTSKPERVPTFDEMGLKDELLRGIYAYGFEKPTEIQGSVIPSLSARRDVIGQAQAGSGKTAAYAISILQAIDESKEGVQGIIVVPTRELAQQAHIVFESLSHNMRTKTIAIYGGDGAPNEIENKKQLKDKEIKVVVSTIGRLISLINKNFLSLDEVKMLVVDEADEMLKEGHHENMQSLITRLASTCTIAMFSATMPREVVELSKKFLTDPLHILVATQDTVTTGVKSYVVELDYRVKDVCLHDLLTQCRYNQAIVFTNTQIEANKVFEKLTAKNHSCGLVHGGMSQTERNIVIGNFRSGMTKILVSTDLLARGFDMSTVSLVINYDIPNTRHSTEGAAGGREVYVHRIGRAGRSTGKGAAINFVASPSDKTNLEDIIANYRFEVIVLPEDLRFL
jgi:superfamily II DNA/RNA helicase